QRGNAAALKGRAAIASPPPPLSPGAQASPSSCPEARVVGWPSKVAPAAPPSSAGEASRCWSSEVIPGVVAAEPLRSVRLSTSGKTVVSPAMAYTLLEAPSHPWRGVARGSGSDRAHGLAPPRGQEAVALHLPVEVRALDAQGLRRTAHVAARLLVFPPDVALLEVLARVGQGGEVLERPARRARDRVRRRARAGEQGRGQVPGLDAVSRGHDHQALDDVPQLAHVARPGQAGQQLQGLGRQVLGPPAVLAGDLGDEVP